MMLTAEFLANALHKQAHGKSHITSVKFGYLKGISYSHNGLVAVTQSHFLFPNPKEYIFLVTTPLFLFLEGYKYSASGN
ncbi:MAG: hypothetical protein D6756_12110 [Cyanobacteria bacterium J083]|nr:MAG: hypothetical protein D6756_12110 [Cyanobacteria bacterium J083]